LVCVDTSFLISLIRREASAEKKLETYLVHDERIATTPICACELFAGAYRSSKRDSEIRKVRGLLSRMELLEFSMRACEGFGRIRQQLEAAGTPIGDLDIIIASIALAHGESLLSRDTQHFSKIPGLHIETW